MKNTAQEIRILTKVKSGDVCKHLSRILGVTVFEIQQKYENDLDISGLTLKTENGTVKFSAGSYSGEFNVHVTIPEKRFRVKFAVFGTSVEKDFPTLDERQEFIEKNEIKDSELSEVEI